jgi:hypothetical protein
MAYEARGYMPGEACGPTDGPDGAEDYFVNQVGFHVERSIDFNGTIMTLFHKEEGGEFVLVTPMGDGSSCVVMSGTGLAEGELLTEFESN